MYGLIGRMLSTPGRRDDLLAILLDGQMSMPGCRSYVVARDPASDDGIWVTEVWDSREQHQASLQIAAVRDTIAKARPLIAGFAERFETEPRGGIGI